MLVLISSFGIAMLCLWSFIWSLFHMSFFHIPDSPSMDITSGVYLPIFPWKEKLLALSSILTLIIFWITLLSMLVRAQSVVPLVWIRKVWKQQPVYGHILIDPIEFVTANSQKVTVISRSERNTNMRVICFFN